MDKDKDKNIFEVCTRVIIQERGKILVCKNRKKGYYFFPGGHINFGESAKKALMREVQEELNILVKKCSFIGIVENIFIEENQRHHEINLIFKATINKISSQSQEDHIDFELMDLNKFSRENILPVVLKKSLLKWFKEKRIFWASQIYNKSIL